MKKYEFTKETKRVNGHTLRRIRCRADGVLGGFIETVNNLSQTGACWLGRDSVVYEHAFVGGDAKVSGCSIIHGSATARGKTSVMNSFLDDCAQVAGNAQLIGASLVGNTTVEEDASVTGICLTGNTRIAGCSVVSSSSDFVTLTIRPWNITVTASNVMIGCQTFKRRGFPCTVKAYNAEVVRRNVSGNVSGNSLPPSWDIDSYKFRKYVKCVKFLMTLVPA